MPELFSQPTHARRHNGRRLGVTVWLLLALLLAPFVSGPTVELGHWPQVEQGQVHALQLRIDQPAVPALANGRAALVKAKQFSDGAGFDVVLPTARPSDPAGLDLLPAIFPRKVVRDLRRALERRGYLAQAPP